MDNENICGSEEAVEMFCEICRKKDENRTADGFCEDCVLYLCSNCLAYHSIFLSDHDQKDANDMPKDVCLKVCPRHADEIIKFYCASCDKFCCSLCKTNEHKTCENIKHLPHIVVDLENKDKLKSFVKEIELIVSEIGDLEFDIENKNVLVESISSGIKSQMDKIRERLHQIADTRIESITKDLEATKEKDKKALAADALETSVIKSEINALNADVKKLLRETKRCELFITMKESCMKRKALESDLQKLKEHGITEFEFEEEDNCNKLFEAASSFGKLVFKNSECDDEQNGGKTLTQEELKELVAVKDEENKRLTKDIKDFEANYSALEKEQRNLKELVAKKDEEIKRWNQEQSTLDRSLGQTKKLVGAKDEEIKRLNKGILESAAKYSALERNYKQTEEIVAAKDKEIKILNKDKQESAAKYSALERKQRQTEVLVNVKDEEIKRLKKDIQESAAKYSALERKQRQTEVLVNDKDEEIKRLNKDMQEYTEIDSVLGRTYTKEGEYEDDRWDVGTMYGGHHDDDRMGVNDYDTMMPIE